MHWGWPLNTDSSVSFTQSREPTRTLKGMCVLRMRRENQYPLSRHSLVPRYVSLPLIILLLYFASQVSSTHLYYPFSSHLLSSPFFPFAVLKGIHGTYLAEEMTSLCLSESRILARWEATESAYWVMWTWEKGERDFGVRRRTEHRFGFQTLWLARTRETYTYM